MYSSERRTGFGFRKKKFKFSKVCASKSDFSVSISSSAWASLQCFLAGCLGVGRNKQGEAPCVKMQPLGPLCPPLFLLGLDSYCSHHTQSCQWTTVGMHFNTYWVPGICWIPSSQRCPERAPSLKMYTRQQIKVVYRSRVIESPKRKQ